MRIDLHCHTKKTKSGDSEKRNVSKKIFLEKLSDYQVKFVAITNHNEFDFAQYLDFSTEASINEITVWPGIELDVKAKKSIGHIIVVCNPREVESFNTICLSMIGNKNADDFSIEIDELFNKISSMNVILIAHHGDLKKDGFVDYDLNYINESLLGKLPVLFEPSSMKSVGILYAHEINAFIGSDISDWNNYSEKKLPELKMDISNFNTFILLLKKDPQVIKTFLSQKKIEVVKIQPFIDDNKPDLEYIELPIYNDINIIFGGKGTGKSKIVNALKSYYQSKGETSITYYTGQTKEKDYENLIKRTIKIEHFNLLKIDSCEKDFKVIKEWKESTITSTSAFFKGVQSKNNGGNFSKFGFTRASFSTPIDENKYNNVLKKFNDIDNSINSINSSDAKKYLSVEEYITLNELFKKIKTAAFLEIRKVWIEINALKLEKFSIEKMKLIATSKTGNHSIPASTGLIEFYQNALSLYNAAKTIINNMSSSKKTTDDYIGEVSEKGRIFVRTEVYINPTEGKEIEYITGKPTASTLKKIFNSSLRIKDNAFKICNSQNIKEFNESCSNNCASLKDCFGIKSFECKADGSPYSPSGGEASMILLNNSLIDDNKSIYILDEPELSVGHKYINDYIVPRLIELSKLGKTLIISTHDANIAVRTLPLNSIYREYKKTYIGNLFIDTMIDKNGNILSWTTLSLGYLEGGQIAFEERGESYGL